MAVLITGGSRGIGAACVRAFVGAGHDVGFIYEKSESNALALARETGAMAIRADVANRAQVFDAVARFGGADVLVCCAGVAWFGLFQDMGEMALRRLMDVNALGTFFAAQAVAPGMIDAGRGAMVFISSIWGQVGASCEAAYSMSKGAQIALAKALAKELGPSGVRVNCIAPGVIDTQMNAGFDPDALAALAEETPLGRIGTPQDVANAALFLASDAAGFITGQVLSPNGGLSV